MKTKEPKCNCDCPELYQKNPLHHAKTCPLYVDTTNSQEFMKARQKAQDRQKENQKSE